MLIHTIKSIATLLVLSVVIFSCSTTKKLPVKTMTISVTDIESSTKINNAEVILTSIYDARDINSISKYTDSLGVCRFTTKIQPNTFYRLYAKKSNYQIVYSDGSPDGYRSDLYIDNNTKDEVSLYLTSDPQYYVNYWKSKSPKYNVDTLMAILTANNYKSGMPLLEWEDIPKLLEYGNNTTLITNFPKNPISSYMMKNCYVGIISLWLIESIRTGIIHEKQYPFNYPSQNPILINKDSYGLILNNTEELNEAYNYYKVWWESVRNMSKEEACKIDPLGNAELVWR